MSQLLDFTGANEFCPGGYTYPNPKESSLFLSIGRHVDVYFPPRKRSRISAPRVFCNESFGRKQQASIEVLPDECLFEVFRRISAGQDKSSCACVSKRWLMLLSSIRRDEISAVKPTQPLNLEKKTNSEKSDEYPENKEKGEPVEFKGTEAETEEVRQETEFDGYLSRCLEGKKATDVRLAAIAVGTGSRGGLGKLSVRGSNATHGLSNIGLQAIGRGCPSLRVLSLWNITSVGDEGLVEIANGCHLLEKLDLCHCPGITDKGLVAIAKNCPNLNSITIESCINIGNESLQALGRCCPNLKSIAVENCLLVGDQGIANLCSSAGHVLSKVKLQTLNISDVSLAVIGHYCSGVTDLALIGLQNVNERGFWVMGNGQGLQNLSSFMVTACAGVSDLSIEAVGQGCPNLREFCLRKCPLVSDNGLISFSRAAGSLESLQLEECHRITQSGVLGAVLNCCGKLKALALSSCLGIREANMGFTSLSRCHSLRSLTICNCPGFGNAGLALLGRLCPNLMHVDLSRLQGITDEGLLPLVQSCEAGLSKVNLSGCHNLTDKSISAVASLHGSTLELLNLDGCINITDVSLVAIARNCCLLSELDVSRSCVTDAGIAVLASSMQQGLQILSLSGCFFVSDKCLPSLGVLGQTLVGLNIQNCTGISCGSVDMLVEQLWRCDILY